MMFESALGEVKVFVAGSADTA